MLNDPDYKSKLFELVGFEKNAATERALQKLLEFLSSQGLQSFGDVGNVDDESLHRYEGGFDGVQKKLKLTPATWTRFRTLRTAIRKAQDLDDGKYPLESVWKSITRPCTDANCYSIATKSTSLKRKVHNLESRADDMEPSEDDSALHLDPDIPDELGSQTTTIKKLWPTPEVLHFSDEFTSDALRDEIVAQMKQQHRHLSRVMVRHLLQGGYRVSKTCFNEAALASMVGYLLEELTARGIVSGVLDETHVYVEQLHPQAALRPDGLISSMRLPGNESYRIVFEVKCHWKWGADVGAYGDHGQTLNVTPFELHVLEKDNWEDHKWSAVRQLFVYMIAFRLKYGILTTYTYWWLFKYGGDWIQDPDGTKRFVPKLYVSKPIPTNGSDPALTISLLRFIQVATTTDDRADYVIPENEIDRDVLDIVNGWSAFKMVIAEMKDRAKIDVDSLSRQQLFERIAEEVKHVRATTKKKKGKSTCKGGAADAAPPHDDDDDTGGGDGRRRRSRAKTSKSKRTPGAGKGHHKSRTTSSKGANGAPKDDCDPKIVEYYGEYGRTGVVWKIEYQEEFYIAKVNDFAKCSKVIREEMIQERDIYNALEGLQGVTIPRFVGLINFNCGRFGICTKYMGRQLHLPDGFDLLQRLALANACMDCLQALHVLGYAHGDIRRQNIVLHLCPAPNEKTTGRMTYKPYLIDLAFTCRVGHDSPHLPRERAELSKILQQVLGVQVSSRCSPELACESPTY